MRIRTIKPEFWSHPVLARMDPLDRLAAIGLLNMADDEGYFLADPALVRSALFTFTDPSLINHGLITRLCAVGWIEVLEHPTHGHIGRVVNFLRHQVVNRPKPSRIKGYWESVTNHGLISDESRINHVLSREQGTGNRERGNEGTREHNACAWTPPPYHYDDDPGDEHPCAGSVEIASPAVDQDLSGYVASRVPPDIPPRLLETWREIAQADGAEVAGRALEAARRIFRGPSCAQLLETWKAAADSDSLELPSGEWPDFRESIRAAERQRKNPTALQASPEGMATAREFAARVKERGNA